MHRTRLLPTIAVLIFLPIWIYADPLPEETELLRLLENQRQIAELNPSFASLRELGRVLYAVGQEDEAQHVWRDALLRFSDSAATDIEFANEMLDYGFRGLAENAVRGAERRVRNLQERYEIGSLWWAMGQHKHATRMFQSLLDAVPPGPMPTAEGWMQGRYRRMFPTPLVQRFLLPNHLLGHDRPRRHILRSRRWQPAGDEEIVASALAQLAEIARHYYQTPRLLAWFEERATQRPEEQAVQEQLLQMRMLSELSTTNLIPHLDALIEHYPQEAAYHILRLGIVSYYRGNTWEQLSQYLAQLAPLSNEAYLWYLAWHMRDLYYHDRPDEASALVPRFDAALSAHLTEPGFLRAVVAERLVSVFVLLGRLDLAERAHAAVSPPREQDPTVRSWDGSREEWRGYADLHRHLCGAAIERGEWDRGLGFFWAMRGAVLAPTPNPGTPGYSRDGYPPLSAFYDRQRLQLLHELYVYSLSRDETDTFVARLEAAYQQATGKSQMDAGLALSYVHWWSEAPDRAHTALDTLRNDFPESPLLDRHALAMALTEKDESTVINLLERLLVTDAAYQNEYQRTCFDRALEDWDTERTEAILQDAIESQPDYSLGHMLWQLRERRLTHLVRRANTLLASRSLLRPAPEAWSSLAGTYEWLGQENRALQLRRKAGRVYERWSFYPGVPMRVLTPEMHHARESRLLARANAAPGSVEAQLDLVYYYQSMNDRARTAESFQRAIDADPLNRELRRVGLERFGRQNPERMVEAYTQLLREGVVDLDTYTVMETFARVDTRCSSFW